MQEGSIVRLTRRYRDSVLCCLSLATPSQGTNSIRFWFCVGDPLIIVTATPIH
jgi:hypothetical protein